MNTFGHLFRVTTFGESHGPAMGAVVDGCPAGVPLTRAQVQRALDRRRPGQSALTTARNEPDQVELLSGVYEDKTLGTPIAALVRNQDQRSQDYDALKTKERPGHADRVWRARFQHRDPRGGGRTSGRETLCRVIGGAIAEALLSREVPALRVVAWVSQVERFVAPPPALGLVREAVDAHASRVPDATTAGQVEARILEAKAEGDSLGGAITVRCEGLPVGLGEPVFGKLKARLADALSGIGAVTGVVWGPADLEERLRLPGTRFHAPRADGAPSDVYGGIQGGLSNGEPLEARVLFKPTSTLTDLAKAGRHDPCILPRAVPVVEAMTSMVLADLWLSFLAGPHRP
ncbi:MAG: chorismate synthase [Myxococcaceae bacterium]|nr:chorismate synthase [Myxococcaceae bacterium]